MTQATQRATTTLHERIPSLDGIRAVSILFVILWHVAESHATSGLQQLWRVDPGNFGVRTFFVISGFLITTLLLEESRKSGTISLRRFYFRRTLRIMPAFYVFLAAMVLAAALGWQELSMRAVLGAATYTSNYTYSEWPVGHSWSLAVEEQFYLLWPGLLVVAGLRAGFRVALLMLLVSPAIRTIAFFMGSDWPTNPRYAFETVADALVVGCLLARHRSALWEWSPYRTWLSSRGVVLIPIAMFIAAFASVRWPLVGAAIGISVLNILIAIAIDWALRFPTSLVGTVLNARPMVLIGSLSYSLYLWQQPLLSPKMHMPVAIRLLLVVVCAFASYYFVEKPALRWRQRVERRLFPRAPST